MEESVIFLQQQQGDEAASLSDGENDGTVRDSSVDFVSFV